MGESVMVTLGRPRPRGNTGDGRTGSDHADAVPDGEMAFFLPNGEEVCFCAHAALGGAVGGCLSGASIHRTDGEASESVTSSAFAKSRPDPGSFTYRGATSGTVFGVDVTDACPRGNQDPSAPSSASPSWVGCLRMRTRYRETPLLDDGHCEAVLNDTLLNHLRVRREHYSGTSAAAAAMTDGGDACCRPLSPTNASIARPKTMVEMVSAEAVHQAVAPTGSASSSPSSSSPSPPSNRLGESSDETTTTTTTASATPALRFAECCDALKGSTGIYLYAPRPTEACNDPHPSPSTGSSSWECRQFPRSSGYPEDPATGVAAAALAARLHFHRLPRRLPGLVSDWRTSGDDPTEHGSRHQRHVYNMHQGTAMGRPSLIQVVGLQREDDDGDDGDGGVMISFGLQGLVQIDEHCTVEVEVHETI